jgi:hypothetical protein
MAYALESVIVEGGGLTSYRTGSVIGDGSRQSLGLVDRAAALRACAFFEPGAPDG